MSRPLTTLIGRYELLSELGQGATGIVYKAHDPQLDRVVAIKRLHVTLGGGAPHEDHRRRFAQEATAAGRLNHPNVVAVYDVVEITGVPYIVMEYVDGRTLADLIGTEAPLPPGRAVQLLRPVCWALEYAHARGVVHRDIKPGNILVADSGDVKLGDFGIARLAGHTATQTGAMLGSPAYMSPEQVRGRGADGRSDLFSLGVVLYEALAGVPPFQGDDVATILYQIAHTQPPPIVSRNSDVSPALEAAVNRALAKDPDQRYATGAALADALAEAILPPSVATRAPRHRIRTAWRPTATRRAVALGSACLLGTGLASWAIGSRGMHPEQGEERPEPDRRAPEPPSAESLVPLSIERGQTATTAALPSDGAMPPPTNSGALAGVSARALGRPDSSPRRTASLCLSVNAIPYARVFVDGHDAGETPKGCVRVSEGEHRVHFEASGARSPERVVRLTEEHTASNAVRISYDFRNRRFVE